jgi:pyridinium-3,5-bisthiocarboxylic acid mononucleotide nickel chelatase
VATIAYFDGFSGASGDMVIGALLDLGLPLDGLRAALGSLEIEYGTVSAERVLRAGVSATQFHVTDRGAAAVVGPAARRAANHDDRHSHAHEYDRPHHHASGADHHSLAEIASAIERSALSRAGKDRAIRLFRRLGEAEAAIHGVPLDRVHLHEVGALDSIIDIVGAVHGMEWLGADQVVASPLNVGSGTVVCAHGTFPVPAPATARLLEGVPIYAGEVAAEMVTPTGALLLTEYAGRFDRMPPMRVRSIGYGAGSRDFSRHPNVLRILVGDVEDARATETIVVLECEIDDMNPQLFGPLMDRLQQAGALDVFYAPVQMKKNRPGTLVTVLAVPSTREALSGILFAETTTIGVRYQDVRRERLEREVRTVRTPLGPIRFKVATRDGRVLNASPEFDDCARLATEHGVAIKEVQAIATKAWLDSTPDPRVPGHRSADRREGDPSPEPRRP